MMRHLLPSQVSITAEDPLDLVERERDYQHLLTLAVALDGVKSAVR